MDHLDLYYVHLFLLLVNVVLHSICSLLLAYTYQNERPRKTQPLYLLNLSISELLRNSVNFSIDTYMFISKPDELFYATYITFVWVVELTFVLPYLAAMFLLTGDRLAACLLGIQYNIKCTVFRAKATILTTWIFSVLVVPSAYYAVYIGYGYREFSSTVEMFRYIWAALIQLHMIFAIVSYIIMFTVFVRSRRRTNSDQQQSLLQLFAHSKFYVAILLISTFIVMQGIPALFFIYYTQFSNSNNGLVISNWRLFVYYAITVTLSDTTDAMIYVFLYNPIRNLLQTKLRVLFSPCLHLWNRTLTEVSLLQLNNRIAVIPGSQDAGEVLEVQHSHHAQERQTNSL